MNLVTAIYGDIVADIINSNLSNRRLATVLFGIQTLLLIWSKHGPEFNSRGDVTVYVLVSMQHLAE